MPKSLPWTTVLVVLGALPCLGWMSRLAVHAAGSAASSPATTASAGVRAIRLEANPIITPEMLAETGDDNINGPSLLRVPDWVDKPLGKYYLYFASHRGKFIRLAYADKLAGPWKIHPPGVLSLKEAPCKGHIASPDVHADPGRKEIRMYFHGMDGAGGGQVSFVATSTDGLKFAPKARPLGPFYFRVFQYGGYYYAMAKAKNESAVLLRSKDGLGEFQTGPTLIPRCRHTAMKVCGDALWLFFSRIGDAPEQILLTRIDLKKDWTEWEKSMTTPVSILRPEKDYEGVGYPVKPSGAGAMNKVHQLRDPAVFEEGGKTYLLYSVAGESGIAIAELRE